MPKLSAIVDSLDTVAEAHRELYTKRADGKFQLDADGVEDVSGLKSALERQKEDARQAKEAARQFQGLGLSAEEIAQLVKDKKERDEKKLKDEGDFASLKAQLLEQHKGELGKHTDRSKKLMQAIEKLVAENAAIAEIAKASGNAKLLLPHVKASLKVIEDEATGEFSAVVVDAKGNTRIGGTDGAPMTIAQYVAELKASDDYAGAFKGSGASGSGAAGSSTRHDAGAADALKHLSSPEAKLAYAREHNLK